MARLSGETARVYRPGSRDPLETRRMWALRNSYRVEGAVATFFIRVKAIRWEETQAATFRASKLESCYTRKRRGVQDPLGHRSRQPPSGALDRSRRPGSSRVMKNPYEPQAAQKGPDARRRRACRQAGGSEGGDGLRCTLQRRATASSVRRPGAPPAP